MIFLGKKLLTRADANLSQIYIYHQLHFKELDLCIQQIEDPFQDTFEWAFDLPALTNWLQQGFDSSLLLDSRQARLRKIHLYEVPIPEPPDMAAPSRLEEQRCLRDSCRVLLPLAKVVAEFRKPDSGLILKLERNRPPTFGPRCHQDRLDSFLRCTERI